MSSRTTDKNTNIPKFAPAGTPDILTNVSNVKSVTSTDTIEVWADGAIWDVTTNSPISVDKFNFTGTPRKRL